MIPLERISDEVFVAAEDVVSLGARETAFIKDQALRAPRRRARICAHPRNDDLLHEMLIAITADSYIRPHRHVSKSESFHIVEGLVDVVIFDDEGGITHLVELGGAGSGRAYFYRLSASRFHTLCIRSDVLVMHEATNGPFDSSKTILADFAPPEADLGAVAAYRQRLERDVARFDRSGKS